MKKTKQELFTANVGCEFEFSTPWEEMLEIVSEACKKIYGEKSLYAKQTWFKSKKNYQQWHLKTDATTECEFCTPISKFSDLPKICRMVNELKKKKVKITRNDSLHVHISADGIDPRQLVAAWLTVERTLIKCFPRYRRQKYESGYRTYCAQLIEKQGKKNVATLFDRAMEISTDHHSVFSLYHFAKRKTVEFRIAEGTADQKFVTNWVSFCLWFVQYAKTIDVFNTLCKVPEELSVRDMIAIMKINDRPLIAWLEERYEKFSSRRWM